MLGRRGIQHNVLNAKFHKQEAEIVAQAGVHGAVTIATNMAGRGTDIKLDDEARAAGGLKIIGTERHESRRIDNQLRGRSGRQGDPGESRFYISLEDDLMRLFGSEKLMTVFNALPDGEEIHHKLLTKSIENAQKKIEGNNFGIRKNLLDYDQVMNDQREIIYDERRRVLNGEDMHPVITKMIDDYIAATVAKCAPEDDSPYDVDLNRLGRRLYPIIPVRPLSEKDLQSGADATELLTERAHQLYEDRAAEMPDPEQIRELERVVLLKVIDRKWMDHIDNMEILREGIGLTAYGQRNPLVEYKMAGFDMFDEMIQNINEDTIRLMYHAQLAEPVEREEVAKPVSTNKTDDSLPKTKTRSDKKIYPNDPCPCGSGKKYKQCCGRK